MSVRGLHALARCCGSGWGLHMETDLELEAWRRDWRAESSPPLDLRARVERDTRRMHWAVAAEVLVTVVYGLGSLGWAVVSRRPEALALSIGVWTFIAIAWTISLVLRRGAWAPVTSTTAAFLELSILRCRRKREAIFGMAVLYVLILAFDLAWISAVRGRWAPSDLRILLITGGMVWVWPITLALGALAAWQRRRLRRELATLTRIRLEDQPAEQ
jgi:hypothetical protein